MGDIFIGGVPFGAISHRDGRFVRLPGLFAFARLEAGGVYRVLHLEMSAAINRDADPSHPRWVWALEEGMNALLVHRFGQPAPMPKEAPLDWETVVWHPQAQVVFLGEGQGEELPVIVGRSREA